MPQANIKEQNYYAIKDFVEGRKRSDMQGTKLQALFRLIEKKGEPIKSEDVRFSGVKALQISDCEYVAIKRTGSLHSFFPCALQSILLTKLYEKP